MNSWVFPQIPLKYLTTDMPPLRNQADIISRAFRALREVGFLAIKGHGLRSEDFHHQFDLRRMLIEDVAEDNKHDLHAKISEGSWAGYKPTGYYRRPDGGADTIEHFDAYPFTMRTSRLPDAGKRYVSDFLSSCPSSRYPQYNHYFLLRRVLAILSLGMGLPQDVLWDLHHRGGTSYDGALDTGDNDKIMWNHSKDHLRYAMYHPPSEEDREKKKHLWIPGHTDLGSVSFLYSQPIAGLQVLSPDGEWRYIRHYPEHVIVNLGDSLEFLTGGLLKAVPHRVMEPPSDQRHLDRLGIFYFVPFLPEVPLRPLDSLIAGHADDFEVKDAFEEYRRLGGQPTTLTSNGAERRLVDVAAKLVGSRRPARDRREPVPEDVLHDIHFRYNTIEGFQNGRSSSSYDSRQFKMIVDRPGDDIQRIPNALILTCDRIQQKCKLALYPVPRTSPAEGEMARKSSGSTSHTTLQPEIGVKSSVVPTQRVNSASTREPDTSGSVLVICPLAKKAMKEVGEKGEPWGNRKSQREDQESRFSDSFEHRLGSRSWMNSSVTGMPRYFG
ncbi:hypothetical protein B0H17DRAFT_1136677 [Mycena rosella]|uniref:Isopenicillin N synthase-like Fe(2+) 2OG dioxygenase domain-containing protein n=1 Tax=Mycena rosella TaxID=1033263 RepID=A0AAD7DA59_MYCRO|nr:hypothetical protein B0H17DRAFT_1136677 [Mycena rosella]